MTTFGCPIDKSAPVTRYTQFLGSFDALGALNSWGHRAEICIPTHHSTNTSIPYSMPVAISPRFALASEIIAEPPKLSHLPALLTNEASSLEQRPAALSNEA